MYRRISLVSLMVLLLVSPLSGSAAWAQGPSVQHSDPFWQASYWNNTSLSGSPVLQRSESNLDYNWGMGSPGPGVYADGFSTRWTRYLDLEAGTYRFTATSDDGLRLYVDGSLLINEWYDHAAKTV